MENLFDKPVKRRGTGSLKWDVAENELPMWVADMDFETAPLVKEAILKRAIFYVLVDLKIINISARLKC